MLKKEAYINGLGCISPQQTFEGNGLPDVSDLLCPDNFFKCLEPVYKKYIDPIIARRMSRIVKMGIYASKLCLEDAGVEMPDAIITGTGLGCLDDTEKFITSMIRNDEKMLNPTPFIQSTHNTISAQIALFLKCHAYNITYAHRGLSFESALLDSLLMLKEQSSESVLLGGVDEITNISFQIIKRLGHWKNDNCNLLNISESVTKGSIAGEGSSFFLLSDKKNNSSYSKIVSLETIVNQLNVESLTKEVSAFFKKNNLNYNDVDLVLLGVNGDSKYDQLYYGLKNKVFCNNSCAYFKHLCGEYHTATSFAMWLSSVMLKNQTVPEMVKMNSFSSTQLKTILIYNHYRNINHSFIIMQAC
ncbi:MAG: beta-ketoacyl synthase N-terminal-like domain-containing protein [Patescibacteria group bacterium]